MDPTRAELAAFINRLNVDEQVHLVALAWIGRGCSSAQPLIRAVSRATLGPALASTTVC